jgi:hypothetical protein
MISARSKPSLNNQKSPNQEDNDIGNDWGETEHPGKMQSSIEDAGILDLDKLGSELAEDIEF